MREMALVDFCLPRTAGKLKLGKESGGQIMCLKLNMASVPGGHTFLLVNGSSINIGFRFLAFPPLT